MGNAAKSKSIESETSSYASKIIQDEADALANASSLIDENFQRAIELILEAGPNSRIVITGMGKASFIGMKISATLASIGFPSFFIHPADAVHGDLGRFTKNDIALVLSKSGETPEIVRLLPLIKRIGSPIISITTSSTSTLGSHSDVVVRLGEIAEAGELGLAPTTSTTVMLAIGDAIAMCLLKAKGFTREEFAQFHPGGELGRALMLVSEIMRKGDAHCIVQETALVKEVVHQITITKGRPGAAAVVNSRGTLVGLFTDGNLRRCIELGTNFLNRPISEVMTTAPKTLQSNHLAQEVARIMREFQIDQIIVVDSEQRPIGLVDIQDLLAHGIK